MKKIFVSLILASFLYATLLIAQPPVTITHNIHINQGTSQCKSAWRGRVGPEDISNYSSFGEYDSLSAPGIQSCTGCVFDSKSNDCVCKSCYADYN